MENNYNDGKGMYSLMSELFPLNRSLTGEGVRDTFKILSRYVNLNIQEISTGEKVFDWEIPYEWSIKKAYIKDSQDKIVIDFTNNNLHVVGYSEPVNELYTLEELQPHLHSLEDQPDAIPYITSYYKRNWGFCMSHNDRLKLKAGDYKVVIDSELFKGKMTFADYIIPGDTKEEIVFSTYICHPSMASNELSGPVVLIYIIMWLESLTKRKYTYRFIFAPETIGAITYLSKNLEILKENVVAGFVVTCIGDDNCYSFVKSRYGNTYADRVSSCVMKEYSNTKIYSYLERGSDERQYCFPGVDLPFVALCRTKFYEYPEYHTSLDNLEYCSPQALSNSFTFLQSHIVLLEKNKKYIINSRCEPQLGKRNLYPNISTKESNGTVQELMDFIVYCDGRNDIIEISEITNIPWRKLITIVDQLQEHNLLKEV